MGHPVIVSVDDEADVLHAVTRDLRSRYADRYRVVSSTSGPEALQALQQLRLRGDPVALLLADQRMPMMSGVEFLRRASDLYPDAKRALLTAYADTDAAIRAINDVGIDHYLLKPWDPPQERLFPVIDDLLDDWRSGFRPPFEGVRIIASRWSAPAHTLRDFLGRNQVPYRWLDIETSTDAATLIESAGIERLPLVVLDDGRVLAAPTTAELAQHLGMTHRAELPFYDLVVVGAGPAGLASAVYGASEGLRTILLERDAPGGQAGSSARIENYLGFPSGLSGGDLARRGLTQARRLGAELLTPREVVGLRFRDDYKIVQLSDGSEVTGKVLLLACGVAYRRLDLPGAEALTGAGVYYGAATSAALSIAGEDVIVVGGGNSAGQAAVFLAGHARTVTVLFRGPSLHAGMSRYLVDRLLSTSNITVRPSTQVVGVRGDGHLEQVTLRREDGSQEVVAAAGLFVFIGAVPPTEFLPPEVARDRHGFVLTGPDLGTDHLRDWPLERPPFLLETNVPGLLCAGDVRSTSVKRVASAVGEGAIAVMFAHRYFAE